MEGCEREGCERERKDDVESGSGEGEGERA